MTDRTNQSGKRDAVENIETPNGLSQRIAEIYRVPALTHIRRQAFDVALQERIEGASRGVGRIGPWLPSPATLGASALATAAIAWLLVWRMPEDDVRPIVLAESAVAVDGSTALTDMMVSIATDSVVADSESLPADYAAINSLFFGG